MISFMLFHGDCLDVLKTLPDNSVDSLVTDPPAGISFMSKGWDSDKGGRDHWIAWMAEVMTEALRVLKPGAHGLVWSLPRTSHWTGMALEHAGFEVRDIVHHLFGSGFPKSKSFRDIGHPELGSALKPAAENWWLVRKPISEKNLSANVQRWGCGAINIDASRIETNGEVPKGSGNSLGYHGNGVGTGGNVTPAQGRFPANLLLSHSASCTEDACCMFECPVWQLDQQSGVSKPKAGRTGRIGGQNGECYGIYNPDAIGSWPADSGGGASRFFYVAKISSSERNAAGPNGHPTVKPKKLMSYLIRMITPPGGTVLDPFTGSGSTGVAAAELGFDFIGIEREAEYHAIAEARIAHATPN